MQKDFHYYGTYLAAKVAGFSDNDARTIAHAAQYVDNSSNSKIKNGSNYYITDFTPLPTVHTNQEIFKYFTMGNYTERLQNELARVWSCFHFLPGNYEEASSKAHTGDSSSSAVADSWTFDNKAKEQFKLMCLPNSEIVREMVNDIAYYQKSKSYYLELLGIRMHSLADTWAHMYHGGLSAWFINDAYDVKELDSRLQPKNSTLIWLYDPFLDDDLKLNKYSCTSRAEFFNSFSYLGHGRMGHFPDYGFKRYAYRPCWSNESIIKNNQEDFLSAFEQMVKAMICIREDQYFDNGYAILPSSVQTKVSRVIATEALDQSSAWKAAIAELGYTALRDYDEDVWLETYKKNKSADTHYYQFNVAATLHVNLVKDVLRRNNIYIDEIPSVNKTKVKIKNVGTNTYFGAAKRSLTYDYPQPDNAGVELSFINPAGALKSGDVVEIRTNETEVPNDYPYLMAWSTPALYYHAREFGMNRSKWELEVKGESLNTPITAGKQFYIKNVHHTDKPNMEQYYSNIIPRGYYYTTTVRSRKNEQLWTLEPVDTNHSYYILCKHGNHAWQIRGNPNEDKLIEQGPLTFTDKQKFVLTRDQSSLYSVHSLYTGKALGIDSEGCLVQTDHSVSDNATKFRIINCCADGYCHIMKSYAEPLRIQGDSMNAGAIIESRRDDTYERQLFNINKAYTGLDCVRLSIQSIDGKNNLQNMAVSDADGTRGVPEVPLFMNEYGGSQMQEYDLIPLDEPNLFYLKNYHNGLYLDIDKGSCADGAALVQNNPHGGDSQKFYIAKFDPDRIRSWIINKASRKFITISRFARWERLYQSCNKSSDFSMFRLVRAD